MDITRILALSAIWMLSACASQQPRETVHVRYGSRHGDVYADAYSSESRTFSRRMCNRDSLQARAVLSQDALILVGETALRSGFFDLPDSIDPNRNVDGEITICGPCATYELFIAYQGRSKKVEWSCDCHGSDVAPAQVKEVMRVLDAKLQALPSVANLPDSDCVHY